MNPNAENEEEQFVAPDFSIINHTPASIYLELESFQQTTNALNDILPTDSRFV